MNKNEILEVLEDWNFWRKDQDTGFTRLQYIEQLQSLKDSNQIIVITGARRSGKSYLMRGFAKKLISEGISKNNILFINFEDPRFHRLDTDLLQKTYETYLESLNPKGSIYIFLDEIQEVSEWEKWVRTMHELKKANLIISGSNARLLSRELSTLITGRHVDITVFPLSFKEFLSFNNLEVNNSLDLVNKKIDINRLLSEYFEYGSFPGVVLAGAKKQILLAYFDDLLNKDLIRRYKIRKTGKIKELAIYYLSNISTPSTYNSLKKQLLLTTDTIKKFSNYIESIYLIFFVKRFSFKLKEQEKSPRKTYAIDVGLSNQVGFRFSLNTGRMAENLVFLELLRKKSLDPEMELFYFKNERHQEVDFVIKEFLEVKSLIQVCWNIEDLKTKKREINSLIVGLEDLNLKKGLVITEDYENVEYYKEFEIKFIPLYKWLLNQT
ncbi:MAG: ATP-binding protein [Actinobacteria bacterium]|nr:ATP-binding protein [Actinomycetota bacterium]